MPESEQFWADVRSRYPGAVTGGYLDTATKGIPSPRTVARVAEYCEVLRTCPGRSATDDAIALMASADEAREQAAALIGASATEIALMPSTQHGLLAVLERLALGAGDTVVTDDLEFLGVTVPLRLMERDRGIGVRIVEHRDGAVSAEALVDAIDDSTRAVVVSSAQEVNSASIDLQALGRACSERGVALVVDAVQHVGAAPLDVGVDAADFVAVGGQKWLCSPFGTGFLYISRRWQDKLDGRGVGYMAMRTPVEGWDAYLGARAGIALERDYALCDSAQRFEGSGTPNALGAAALATAIADLRALGLARVHARVKRLREVTRERLQAAGGIVTSPAAAIGGIVSFTSGRGGAADRDLVDHLAARNVKVSHRSTASGGGIRVSVFIYNDLADIEALGTGVEEWSARAGRERTRNGVKAAYE